MVLVIKAMVLIFGAFGFPDEQRRTGAHAHPIAFDLEPMGRAAVPADRAARIRGGGRPALGAGVLSALSMAHSADHDVVRDAVLSAFLISTVASVVAGVAMVRLFAIDYPPHLAHRAAWFLFIFPTSYFMHIDYSESLFLALVLASFVAARRERWIVAGLLGALGGARAPQRYPAVPDARRRGLWRAAGDASVRLAMVVGRTGADWLRGLSRDQLSRHGRSAGVPPSGTPALVQRADDALARYKA